MINMQKAPDSATESRGLTNAYVGKQISTSTAQRNLDIQGHAILAESDSLPPIATGLRDLYQIPLDAGAEAASRWLAELVETGNEASPETAREAIERYSPHHLTQSCEPAFVAGFELCLRQRALAAELLLRQGGGQ